MKKILSLLITFMMLSSTAFADTASELAQIFAKTAEMTSYSGEATLSAQMNKPLEILDTIPVDDETDIDPELIVNSLLNAETKMKYTYSASEDYKKLDMAMSMEFSMPVEFNESFKLDAWTKLGMWINYDVTDEENPVYKIIYKIPFMKKYQVMDMSSQASELMPVLDKEIIKELSEKAVDALTQNAQVTKNQNEYTVKLDNDGAKNYIVEIFKASKEMIPDASEAGVIDQMIVTVEDLFSKTELLGKNGITMKLTKNSQGYITAQLEELHLSFNIFDILEAYSMSTNGLDREKAFVDITFKASTKISDINKAKVTMPELNEENSSTQLLGQSMGYHKFLNESPVFKDNEIYYPLESIAKLTGNELVIKADGETTSITYPNGTTAVITDTAVTIDGAETKGTALITEDGKLYCTELLLYPMNISYISADYNINTNKFSLSFTVEPEYEEPDYIEDDYEFISPTIYCYVYSQQLPYMANDEIYLPICDLLASMFEGEFTFNGDYVEYNASGENVYGISKVSVNVGDKFVTIDGKKTELTNEIINVSNVIRVPLSFTKQLGFTLNGIHIGSGYSDYYLEMANPEYIKEAVSEETINEGNWFENLF